MVVASCRTMFSCLWLSDFARKYFWVEIRAKKENRKLPPKLSLAHFLPLATHRACQPPLLAQSRGSPVAASLPSPPLRGPPTLSFFPAQAHRNLPPRGPAGLLPRPPHASPSLGPIVRGPRGATPFSFLHGPAPPLLAHDSQARRVDGSAAMHSGNRFFNCRPLISRRRRENRPRPHYAVLIRPENSSAQVPNISFFSRDRTTPRLKTAPRRSLPDLLRPHPVRVEVSIFFRLVSPPLLSLFPAESVFFRGGLRACGELARGGMRSRGLARWPEFADVARPHLPSRPLARLWPVRGGAWPARALTVASAACSRRPARHVASPSASCSQQQLARARSSGPRPSCGILRSARD
jgi:hypothetical protein